MFLIFQRRPAQISRPCSLKMMQIFGLLSSFFFLSNSQFILIKNVRRCWSTDRRSEEIQLFPPFSLSPHHFIATKKNTTKFRQWPHIFLAEAGKEKQNSSPSFFPSLLFSLPQNYNVQIHKCMRCFCTLEINITFAENAAAGLLWR